MILYIRNKDDSIAYLEVSNIYMRGSIVIAAGESIDDTSTFNKDDWEYADLRSDEGRLLQLIKVT